MNEKNLEYLQSLLKELGFGKKLNDVLENAIRKEMPKFSLGITTMNRPAGITDVNAHKSDHLSFTLNFNRSNTSDMYFLNDYNVTMKNRFNNIQTSQTFNLERDNRITALQAHKLLSGLSFEKEIFLKTSADTTPVQTKTPLWFKLNPEITDAYGNHPLRTFRPEYGYDINAVLTKYPIKGLDTKEKMDAAISTLKNGNYLETEMTIDKKKTPVIIAANPQMKKMDIYDKNMNEIREESIFPDRNATQKQEAAPAQNKQEELPWAQDQDQQNKKNTSRSR